MKKRLWPVVAALVVGVALSLSPATGGGSAKAADADPATVGTEGVPQGSLSELYRWCAARMHDAVVEDNDAYEARDAERYEAVLNPDMLFVSDGDVTYGRDAIMETARQTFEVPGWHWSVDIQNETTFGCSTGVAVLIATMETADWTRTYHVTMTMTQNWGRWTVAMDSVHLLETVEH